MNISDKDKDREKPNRMAQAREELFNLYDESYVDTSKKVTVKEFLEVYKKWGGNASNACRDLGINYKVYQRMKKKNEAAFAEVKESLKEKEKEFIYNKLLELVAAGNVVATIFACKSILGLKETQVQEISTPLLDVEAAVRELKDRIAD